MVCPTERSLYITNTGENIKFKVDDSGKVIAFNRVFNGKTYHVFSEEMSDVAKKLFQKMKTDPQYATSMAIFGSQSATYTDENEYQPWQ
ncbi:MAG: hypothetical protein WCF65_09150 [Parachlamydiaceae bacterium]